MSKVVYKYLLVETGKPVVIPKGDILHVGTDPKGAICVWVLVNPNDKELFTVVHVIGTGHTIHGDCAEKMEYVTTVIDGPFMWHIFTEDISTTEQQ